MDDQRPTPNAAFAHLQLNEETSYGKTETGIECGRVEIPRNEVERDPRRRFEKRSKNRPQPTPILLRG
jgi:hypothetical protein